MKTKYQRYNKQEKKQCRQSYYNTSEGKIINIRLTRLTLTGIIGILFSFYLLTTTQEPALPKWLNYTLFAILFIFSLVFIVFAFYLRHKKLNEYAIKYLK